MKAPWVKTRGMAIQNTRDAQREKLAKQIRKLMPEFETIEDTYKENVLRIDALQIVGVSQSRKACLELVKTLQNCWPDKPCGSMACSFCQRTRRLIHMQKDMAYLQQHQDDYVMVTLILYADRLPNSDLLGWDYNKHKQRLVKAIQRIGFSAPVVGGFEMDYHSYSHAPEQSHWMPHYHLMMPNEPGKLEQLRQYMLREKNLFARKGKVNRPMRVDKINDLIRQFSYCISGMWMEYSWFLNDKGELKKGKNPYRIRNKTVFAKSLVKLDRLSDGMLTFRVNVQKW